MGFKLLSTREFPEAKFTLYFLGYEHDPNFKQDSMTRDDQARLESIIELTHNWGTESDPEFKGYHNGNSTENGAIKVMDTPVSVAKTQLNSVKSWSTSLVTNWIGH